MLDHTVPMHQHSTEVCRVGRVECCRVHQRNEHDTDSQAVLVLGSKILQVEAFGSEGASCRQWGWMKKYPEVYIRHHRG